jgi:hypothetical protein
MQAALVLAQLDRIRRARRPCRFCASGRDSHESIVSLARQLCERASSQSVFALALEQADVRCFGDAHGWTGAKVGRPVSEVGKRTKSNNKKDVRTRIKGRK